MKTSFLTLVYSLICISRLREVHADDRYASDDEFVRASGSGEMPNEAGPAKIVYKIVEIKFSTKHAFQNVPGASDFIPEVVEELIYALNSEGGPLGLGGERHRPAMTDKRKTELDTKSRDSEENSGAARNKRSTSPLRFRSELKIPQDTDVDAYTLRLKNNPFFHTIKAVKKGSYQTVLFSEAQLREFEDDRLPKRNNQDIGKNQGVEREKPGNNGGTIVPNKPEVRIEYDTVPQDFFKNPATLAAMAAGALAGLLCTILCTIFVVYRMRKKDEGSYALDEPKNSYKYKHEYYIASATKEFFA